MGQIIKAQDDWHWPSTCNASQLSPSLVFFKS